MKKNPYTQFMLESNRIEGENRVNPGDMDAIQYTLNNGIKTLENILHIHSLLGAYLKESWVGNLRTVDVRVGSYICPSYIVVPNLIGIYITKLPTFDSWEAHNEYEKIHPFQDLNGRVGRLIWLSKARKEGYNFNIPFLQTYYYQTLRKFEGGEI